VVDRFAVSRGVRLESPAISGEVPEQQPPNSPSARTPSYWSGDSAEDIGSDASRHLRPPRYHRRAELIWGAQERRGRQALG